MIEIIGFLVQHNNYAAIYFSGDSDYNVLAGNVFTDNYPLTFSGGSHNLVRDSNITGSATHAYLSGSGNLNNTFLNISYSTENVDIGSKLIRKWYVDIYATYDGTNPLSSVTVSITNDGQPPATTQASGYTARQEITQYIDNGTIENRTLSLSATKVGYTGDTFGPDNITSNRIFGDGGPIMLSLSALPPGPPGPGSNSNGSAPGFEFSMFIVLLTCFLVVMLALLSV